MSSVNLVVLVESVQELITHTKSDDKFHIPSLVAVGVALGAPHPSSSDTRVADVAYQA